MSQTPVRILLQGPFNRQDVAELAQTLRRIEQRNTEGAYSMLIDEPDRPSEEIEAFLKQVFPRVEGTPVETMFFPKK